MGWRSDLEVLDLEVCREEEGGQGAVPVFVAVVGQREQSGHLGHQDVAGCSKEQGTNQISFAYDNLLQVFYATCLICALVSAYMCFASHSHRWCG